jgi:hypothetical protein
VATQEAENGEEEMNKRLFVLFVHGSYGGQNYCAVYANNSGKANEKMRVRYPNFEDETGGNKYYNQFLGSGNPTDIENIEAELIFDDAGVSNLWFVGW